MNRTTHASFKSYAKFFRDDECGATAIEYGLFAALIAAVIVGSVATLGTQTNSGFSTVSTALTDAGIEADAPVVEEE